MSTQKELVIEKVKTIVELLIVSLTKAGIEYFKGNPTAEISHKKDNIIVSLIDEDNIEINCFLNQNLRNGKTYFYINKQTLLNPYHDIIFFVESQVKKIQEEINEDSAILFKLLLKIKNCKNPTLIEKIVLHN